MLPNALHNYAYYWQCNPMHCTTMLIISNIIPMHCLYISIALQNFTYHNAMHPNVCLLHRTICISNALSIMLIIFHFMQQYYTLHNYAYHKQFNSNALHYYAYHKQCILSIAQLCLSSAISFQCIAYILLLHCTTMLIISNSIPILCTSMHHAAISFQCILLHCSSLS